MASEVQADNGVNVEALLAAREALTAAPEAAQFKWRAACEWKDGTHSHSTVESFYGLGQDQHRKTTFTFDADHPEVFASLDQGATPVEYVLVGLASCLTAGIAAVAQNRNIQLKSVKATVEGDMDLYGILGIGVSGVRAGAVRRPAAPYYFCRLFQRFSIDFGMLVSKISSGCHLGSAVNDKFQCNRYICLPYPRPQLVAQVAAARWSNDRAVS